MTANPVVFLDLDGTLSRVNSGALYARQLWKEGVFSFTQQARITSLLLRYRMGWVDLESVLERMIESTQGEPVDPVVKRCLTVVREGVLPGVFPAALEQIECHRSRGDTLVILSASSPFIVDPVASALGIPHGLATPLEAENGCFTGRFTPPLCYGKGKVEWAQRFCDEHGFSFENAWFYTDSVTDLPLLERVANPRVVNPDWPLRREAKKRKWEILHWA